MLLSAAVLSSACSEEKRVETQSSEPVMVLTGTAKEIEYRPSMDYAGTALPFREANLGSPLPGRVEKLYYESNDYVKKGALIASLSQNMLDQTKAELDAVKKDYERVQRLQQKGSLTQQDLDHISAKLEATEAKNSMFASFSEIRAPFSGKIVGFLVNEGEVFTIAPGLQPGYSMTSGIVRLMQIDKIKVCVEINEKDYAAVKSGMEVRVFLDAYPDRVFTGKVLKKADFLSTVTHTAEVEIVVNNKEELIKPGMFARVEIEKEARPAVFVPQEAIYKLEGTSEEFLYLLEAENRVRRMPVVREGFKADLVAVKGLKDGQTVLISGQRKVNDGDQVRIAE